MVGFTTNVMYDRAIAIIKTIIRETSEFLITIGLH